MGEQRKKKTFTVSLDEELVKELERRAKKDYLTVQELINKILWRSARSSMRRKRDKFCFKDSGIEYILV